jgi:hypothetical protein
VLLLMARRSGPQADLCMDHSHLECSISWLSRVQVLGPPVFGDVGANNCECLFLAHGSLCWCLKIRSDSLWTWYIRFFIFSFSSFFLSFTSPLTPLAHSRLEHMSSTSLHKA